MTVKHFRFNNSTIVSSADNVSLYLHCVQVNVDFSQCRLSKTSGSIA